MTETNVHPAALVHKTEHPITCHEDIISDEFWYVKDRPEREAAFTRIRNSDNPVAWSPQIHVDGLAEEFQEAGFWALTKRDDIVAASINTSKAFSADQDKGNTAFRPEAPGLIPRQLTAMDPPDHSRHRKILAGAFTPKAAAGLKDILERRVKGIVADAAAISGEFNFVTEIAAKLPMMTIADIVGVPDEHLTAFVDAGNNFVDATYGHVPEGQDPMAYIGAQIGTMAMIGNELVEFRRKHPGDDLATALAQAEIDGKPLTIEDIGGTMLLLSVAGNDTTKQTTSHTFYQLWQNPDQREWLAEDYDARIGQSIEEFVRHASPVVMFPRVLLQDVEMRGAKMAAGDKVMMIYMSGNRDEEIWPDAEKFDIRREYERNCAFGGGGIHLCLGHNVARAQLKVLFKEILTSLSGLEVLGDPVPLNSTLINGTVDLRVKLS